MKPSKNKQISQEENDDSELLTLEELYNDFHIIPDFDESKECYYIEDPDTDEMLTPCLPNEYALIDYINEHWDEIGERLIQIKEKMSPDIPDEYDKAKLIIKTKKCPKKKAKKVVNEN